jgi:membrane protein CcdC involved in cytochrome C biogenesis
MKYILNMLSGTPWWAWAILAYILYAGIKASKTKVISIKKLLLIPMVFSVMSIHSFVNVFNIHCLSVTTWATAILIGMCVGYYHTSRYKIEVNKKDLSLKIPGTWNTLIIVILIFCNKYYLHYSVAVNPSIVTQLWFTIFVLFVSGICSGFLNGRAIRYVCLLK